MTEHTELDQFIGSLGLEYDAKFVPASKAIDADDWDSIHWEITLSNSGHHNPMSFPYRQGVGHLPGFPTSRTINMQNNMKQALETGLYPKDWNAQDFPRLYNLPFPELRDVLYCVVMDADALNYSCFEDWADNLGYSSDSRKAETIYNTCLRQALTFRLLIGGKALEQLSTLFVDY